MRGANTAIVRISNSECNSCNVIIQTGMLPERSFPHGCPVRAEQVFDRRSAAKLYRIFAAAHGVVNPDTSYWEMGCDGSPVPKPCYTALGTMLCRNFSSDNRTRRASLLLHLPNGAKPPRFGKPSIMGRVAVLSASNGVLSVPDSSPIRLMAPQKRCQE